MTKYSSSLFQRSLIILCFFFFRFCCGIRNSFSDLDLSTNILNPVVTGLKITGSIAGDQFGWSVSTAGDIDNDGYADILVGARGRSGNQGAAYVIYGGGESSFLDIDLSTTTLDPLTTGFVITGSAASTYFGISLSTAGDINNDGYDDIIVGAHLTSGGRGTAFIIYGGARSAMSNIVLGSIPLSPSSTGFTITGNAVNDYLGYSVKTAGDINNDGCDDIIVGAYYKNSQQGIAYVIYGGPKSSMINIVLGSTPLNPSTTGFTIIGKAVGDYLGVSVSTAGDINSDGYDDIIIGARGKNGGQGAAYVIYGGDKSIMSNWDLSSGAILNPTSTGFMNTGNAANDYFGWSVGTAGDFNNDGYDDIIVGAYNKNSGQGAAYVIYGGAKSAMSNIVLSTTPLNPLTTGFIMTGNAVGDNFGYSVNTAGDINKDGFDDLIIGARLKNSGQGAVYVIYGGAKSSMSNIYLSTQILNPLTTGFTITGVAVSSNLGFSVGTAGDINKDGFDDIIVGAWGESGNKGAAYLIYASCPKNCHQCLSDSVCAECKNSYFMYQYQCFDSCPIATFTSTDICEDCPSYCTSCTSQNFCVDCIQGYALSNSLCVFTPTPTSNSYSFSSYQEAQEKAYRAISSATQGFGSVICVGSSVFPFSALVSKIVQNTRYLNLSVTSDLTEVYQTWQTDLISWDVPNVMSDLDHFKTSSSLFAQYDLGSPFLINFWPTLLNIGMGLGTFIACFLLKKLFEHEKYEGWAYSLVLKLLARSFNFALVQAYACLDDILFYLVLDAKTNPFNSFFSWASMICVVLFLALGCLLVFFNFWKVKNYQSIKNEGAQEIEAFNERNKYWELFYSDFNDDDLWSQSFFAIALVRSSLSSIVIAVLYDYPLMQASYLVTLDGAIILFLLFKNPFKTLRGKLAQYYYEIITLLVHLCAFILGLQDTFKSSSETVRTIMSTGILYLNTSLICGAIGFMFIEMYKTISEKKRATRLKQRQSTPEETQNLTQTAGIFLPSETETQKTQDSISQDENKSYLFPENNRANSNFINMESNSIADHSLEMNPSRRLNQRRSQNPRSIRIRHRPQGNRSIFSNNGINDEQFSNN